MVRDMLVEQGQYSRVVQFSHYTRHQYLNHILADDSQHLHVGLLLVAVDSLDKIIMLRRNDNRVYTDRLAVLIIFYRHLAFGVRTKISHFLAFATDVGQHAQDSVAEVKRQRHIILRLVRGIAEHHALVSRTLVHRVLTFHTAVDVRTLFMNGREHAATLGLELVFGLGITDTADGTPCYFLQVDVSRRLDLSGQHDLSCSHQSLTCHLRILVESQQLIQYGIRNLVCHFGRDALRTPTLT